MKILYNLNTTLAEIYRQKMHKLVNRYGLTDHRVITASQELDKILVNILKKDLAEVKNVNSVSES